MAVHFSPIQPTIMLAPVNRLFLLPYCCTSCSNLDPLLFTVARPPAPITSSTADSRLILSIMSLISSWLGATASKSSIPRRASSSSSSRSSSAALLLLLPRLLRLPTLPTLLERGLPAPFLSTERRFLAERLVPAPPTDGRSCEEDAVGRSTGPVRVPLPLDGAVVVVCLVAEVWLRPLAIKDSLPAAPALPPASLALLPA